MTIDGEARLREELQQLKSVERPKVIEAIADAAGQPRWKIFLINARTPAAH